MVIRGRNAIYLIIKYKAQQLINYTTLELFKLYTVRYRTYCNYVLGSSIIYLIIK